MRHRLVFITVFVIAACGLGYELVAGALASYILGDSITQFSTAIGLYLFAMGVGSYLSKFLETRIVETFIDIELAVALAGGTSATVLFIAFGSGSLFRPVLYGEILLIGTLVGLEIPLLLRILKDEMDFKDLVAKVLTFDYIGALIISLAFPLFFVPKLGLIKTAFAIGLANALVGLWSTWIFAPRLKTATPARVKCGIVISILAAGFVGSEWLTRYSEQDLYADEVVYAKSSRFQRIVITKNRAGFQLFLNGALQFSSADEYRYHEALVHPAMTAAADHRSVLILGGGDGLAAREVLKYPEVENITLVDIDPEMTRLALEFSPLVELNNNALADPRVTIVNDDAMRWILERHGIFDVMIVDFPDPNAFSIGKLYTTRFYEHLKKLLSSNGAISIQATSPLFARKAYWCIAKTLEASDLYVRPYHAFVPSFGEWGFMLAAHRAFPIPDHTIPNLQYLDGASMAALFQLSADLGPVGVEPNRLNNQILVHYYEEEWRKWN
ncbi:MAG: polyamine aminopropyltransferase [Planctomycetota bacterium]